MATAQSPTCTASELPIFAGASFLGASILMIARSVSLSGPDQLRVIVGGISGKANLHPVRTVHNVVIGQNVAVRVHKPRADTRPGALRRGVGISPNGPWKNRRKRSMPCSSP